MRKRFTAVVLAAVVLALLAAVATRAADEEAEPGTVIVAIYHVAPGQHLDFLKWMAAREAVDAGLGLAPTQWYAHLDGDSWDYLGITPERSDAEDAKVEAAVKAKGMTTGFAASLEFRKMISSHTDTYALGPTSAAALVAAAEH